MKILKVTLKKHANYLQSLIKNFQINTIVLQTIPVGLYKINS